MLFFSTSLANGVLDATGSRRLAFLASSVAGWEFLLYEHKSLLFFWPEVICGLSLFFRQHLSKLNLLVLTRS